MQTVSEIAQSVLDAMAGTTWTQCENLPGC